MFASLRRPPPVDPPAAESAGGGQGDVAWTAYAHSGKWSGSWHGRVGGRGAWRGGGSPSWSGGPGGQGAAGSAGWHASSYTGSVSGNEADWSQWSGSGSRPAADGGQDGGGNPQGAGPNLPPPVVGGPPGPELPSVEEIEEVNARFAEADSVDAFMRVAASLLREYTNRKDKNCLLYTSPSPRDRTRSRMPSSA